MMSAMVVFHVELLCFVVIATGNLGKVVVITRSTLYVPVEICDGASRNKAQPFYV
jgi:hypothetical protein